MSEAANILWVALTLAVDSPERVGVGAWIGYSETRSVAVDSF